MPVEIKELVIQARLKEEEGANTASQLPADLEKWQADLRRSLMREVEQLLQQQQRYLNKTIIAECLEQMEDRQRSRQLR